MKILPKVSKTTISDYNKKFFGGAKPTRLGRKPKVTEKTQLYITNSIRNERMDGPKGAVKFLASQKIAMTNDGVKKLFRKKASKARRKFKANMISQANKKLRLA